MGAGKSKGTKSSKISRSSSEYNIRQESQDLSLKESDSFKLKLAAQNSKNAKELEEKKEERRRTQKEYDEELQKLRAESRKRFEILLMCIVAKRRFEEQEENWRSWIQKCRGHIVLILSCWEEFASIVEKDFKGLRKPEKIDQKEFEKEAFDLLKSVMMAYNALQFDFENLESIQNQFPDALFVRVLMKCIANVASLFLEISNKIETMKVDKNHFNNLQDHFLNLRPDSIYSTSKLKEICQREEPADTVEFPKIAQSVHVEFL